MNIRRQAVGVIERADPDETDRLAGSRVVAPQSNPAHATANDQLALSAVAGSVDALQVAGQVFQAAGLDQRIECKCSTRLPLAPTTVAAVHK